MIFDFATLWNRSKRFMDRAVFLHDGASGDANRFVKLDVVEKACEDAREATKRRAVRFIVLLLMSNS